MKLTVNKEVKVQAGGERIISWIMCVCIKHTFAILKLFKSIQLEVIQLIFFLVLIVTKKITFHV